MRGGGRDRLRRERHRVVLAGRPEWEEVGGVFVHHKSAKETLKELAAYFPLREEV